MSQVSKGIDQHSLFEHASHASWHGRYFRCYCPFHGEGPGSKMPSLLVYEDGAVCLGKCQKRYTLKQVEQKLRGQPGSRFQPACDSLGWRNLDDATLEDLALRSQAELQQVPYYGNVNALEYLANRGIDQYNAPSYYLGTVDNHITISVYDTDHNFMTMVGRNLGDGERYYQSRPPMPYCPNWARLQFCKNILVVYGMFDAIHLNHLLEREDAAVGYCNFGVITSTHGKNFNPEWLAPFRKRIIPIPDAGEEKAAYKLSSYLGWRGQKPLLLPYTDKLKDPADFIEQGKEKQLWRLVSAIRS